jgi:dihydropteroate synthase
MGIVNLTPDSFSDAGLFLPLEKGVAHALDLLGQGADLLDLGAESTRPGSRAGGDSPAVGADEEQARLLPVLEAILQERPNAILSVDTYKAATAKAALAAGAEIVNDVSGFFWDSGLAPVCTAESCGVILMHTRGRPEQWATLPLLDDDVISEVRGGLAASLDRARAAGIREESIVLDPGYGFGKRGRANFALLARQAELLALSRPLLAGLSRKSFLGEAIGKLHSAAAAPVNERENASLAALVVAILHGASIVRVHAVRQAVEAARVADAVLCAAE